jgi:hypothetical protein
MGFDMKVSAAVLCIALAALPLAAAAGGGGAVLDYHFRARLADQDAPVEGGFRLVTSPALVVRSRVKKPRMGSWRIEPLPGSTVPLPAGLLVRMLEFCYFSGPTAQTAPLDLTLALGHRRCRLWQVQAPPGAGAYAYLAELAPGLLAVDYLSAVLPAGAVRSLELRLAGVAMGPRPAPAEEGTALLRSLRAWSVPVPDADPGQPVTEEVS